MTRVGLIYALRQFCEAAVKDMELPQAVQKGDTELRLRAPDVYAMRLPDSGAAQKLAPYIIVQLVDSKHARSDSRVPSPSYVATVRFIFCVWSRDEQEGAVMLLNLMDRVQEQMLKSVQIGNCYTLDEYEGLESVVYPDNTAPYYAGEMVGVYHIRPTQREVDIIGRI